MKKMLVTLIAFSLIFPIFAQGADRIIGVWFNGDKSSKIEISKNEAGKFEGHIVWLKEPNDAAGEPKTDHNNPQAKLAQRPLLGLQVLSELDYKGKGKYDDGKIYDPQSGKTYSAKAEMVNNNTLALRGYIGISFAGRTVTWTRTTK